MQGTASDNGPIAKAVVDGREARPLRANFAEWDVSLDPGSPGATEIKAHAEDLAGNVERLAHVVQVDE